MLLAFCAIVRLGTTIGDKWTRAKRLKISRRNLTKKKQRGKLTRVSVTHVSWCLHTPTWSHKTICQICWASGGDQWWEFRPVPVVERFRIQNRFTKWKKWTNEIFVQTCNSIDDIPVVALEFDLPDLVKQCLDFRLPYREWDWWSDKRQVLVT